MQKFGTAVLGPKFFSRLSKDRLEQVQANAIRPEFTGSGMVAFIESDFGHVLTPTLLLNGQQSPALFHRLADRLAELLPNCERVQISNASHIMHEDNPSAYNDAVLSFLAKHR
jgi:pimeloyl-ACP methyl ester carboxylesterase